MPGRPTAGRPRWPCSATTGPTSWSPAAWRQALPGRLHRLRLDVSRPLEAVVGEAREEVVRLLEARAVARLGAGWAGLPSRSSPRWLVPRGPRRPAAAALAIYQPMTSR